MIRLWLDDVREPWRLGYIGWTWVKTAEEAIALLATGGVAVVSLDRDLSWEHEANSGIRPWEYKTKSGEDVLTWMVEHNVWPEGGVRVRSRDETSRNRMQNIINEHYPNKV